MNKSPSNDDLQVFIQVAEKASFAAEAVDLGVSVAYVSKRIRALESVLNTRLLHLTTRRVSVTEQGEKVLRRDKKILDDIDQLYEEVAQTRQTPILPEYWQTANVWAVYPQRLADSAKVRACVEHLQYWFASFPSQG